MLAGQAGAGKTGTAVNIASTISRGDSGGQWPDGTAAPSGNVVFWTCEDGVADTIIPRFIAAGANMSRLFVLTGTEENGRQRAFNPAKDLERLMQRVLEIGNVSLIIIDPILQVVSGDSHKNAEVRRALEPLVAFSEEHGIAILGITHVNKRSKGKDLLDRITGSLAYTAMSRIVILAVKGTNTEGNDARNSSVLVRAKSNLGPIEGGFTYQVEPYQFESYGEQFETSVLVWNPIQLEGAPEAILRDVERNGGDYIESTNALAAARSFLENLLAKGGLPYPSIVDVASRQNPAISVASLKRAKTELGLFTFKKPAKPPYQACHYWYLSNVLDDQDPSLLKCMQNSPMEVRSFFDPPITPTLNGNFWGGSVPISQSPVFTAPHAPYASVEPHEPVAPRDNELYLVNALELAVKEAQRAFSSRKQDADVPMEDLIFEIEEDVTENLLDDATLLAELRRRLRAQQWWALLPPLIR